jgi:cell division protein FtsN
MAKEYRRAAPAPVPARSSQKRRQNRSCVWWFLLGGLVGGFATHLYWMRHAQAPAAPAATPPAPAPASHEPPTFEFQQLLNETRVEIGGSEPPPPPPAPRPQPPAIPPGPNATVPEAVPPAPAGNGSYLVQVASFKRATDAERLKARLAQLGIVSSVQPVTMASGEVYHRVRTGPYPDKKSVEEVRALLKRNGQDSMTISIK